MRRRFFNAKNIVLNYFSIISLEDNSTVALPTNTSPELMYSLDGIDWTQWDYSTITLGKNDTLYLKGNNSNGFSTSIYKYNTFSITGKVEIGGNIMSLLYEDDFEDNNTLPGYTFFQLFYNCTGILAARNLILPATILANDCYNSMFMGCTKLTSAPNLTATTLADSCYERMFYGCTKLTSAPELPVTTLVNGCYQEMFLGCSSLTTAPELPATTLASSCYNYMFQGCTSLTTAPTLPATTLANYCYRGMFQGCDSLVAAPELPATTLAVYCYSYMFAGCTSLTTVPELPASTLVNYCYQAMFKGCSSLENAPELKAQLLTSNCYYSMFFGCRKINKITMLATDISANNCLSNWVVNVSSIGTFVKHPDMTSLPSGNSGIPTGWTVENYGVITNDPFNGHEYVDLGLPSGTLWATSVIGGDNPLYFAWGDTEGWTAEQINNGEKAFAWDGSDYKWNGGELAYVSSSLTKYNATDGKVVLDLDDDAAHVHMGGDWHMPTKEQCDELTANTTSTWTTQNGVNGRLFTSKVNGNSVFVPAFGLVEDGNVYGVGSNGRIWSSSVNEEYQIDAWNLIFSSSYFDMSSNGRPYGQVVFGVVG